MAQPPATAGRRARIASLRTPLLLCIVAVVVIGVAVYAPAANQRAVSDRIANQNSSVELMLTAMLDQETGLRGYSMTARRVFLEPYYKGQREYDAALADAESTARGDDAVLTRLQRADATARQWQDAARAGVADVAAHGRLKNPAPALHRKAIMDRYRAAIASTQELLADRRNDALRQAEIVPVVLVVALSIGFLVLAWFLVARPRLQAEEAERERRRRSDEQAEFAEALQMTGDEGEAHELLQRHLERALPGRRAAVLSRNSSENRLDCATGACDGLSAALVDAEPRSCLAIRHGRRHTEGGDERPLIGCELCRSTGAVATECTPSLVGGQVIGSVLVAGEAPLDDTQSATMRSSIAQAAPVLANLRTLARAERRAATDALTGLPNARSVQDTLKRLVAQAGRTQSPIAAIMLDLDHFKSLNDDYGHEAGNEVLAGIGRALHGTVRASDFVGRYGGEEFIVLLPDTGLAGAGEAAEKLRRAIAATSFSSVPRSVTASLGVAAIPDNAVDGPTLVRFADRALYLAKERGRNRVEVAAQNTERTSPPSTASSSPVT